MTRADEPTEAGASEEIGSLLARSPDIAGLDVYLAPHCDDVCFSLGAHAHRRHSGVLLTVCPIGGYIATPGKTVAEITAIRLGEESAFARSCGLVAGHLRIEGASVLGHDPFDATWLEANTRRIAGGLLDALHRLAARRASAARPWLFCPGGIGGHIDHLAVRDAVIHDKASLAGLYKLAFYEDLHYASEEGQRRAGIADLTRAAAEPRLKRFIVPVAERHDVKLRLVNLYPSQLPPAQSLDLFTPCAEPHVPHEAVWSVEATGPDV